MKVWAPQKVWKHQPNAVLNQPNPVQNTWYTIPGITQNAKIYMIASMVEAVDETLEVRLTIDGVVYVGSFTQVAGTWQAWVKDPTAAGLLNMTANYLAACVAPLEGRSVKVEVRKTTATGAGTLHGRVTWAKM